MLSQAIIEQNAMNRGGERMRVPLSKITAKIMLEDYENLIEWLLEVISASQTVKCLFFGFVLLIQLCDYIQLRIPTKFLTRTYLDSALNFESQVIPQDLPKLAITCLSLAIKLIHNQDDNDKYSPPYLYSLVGLEISSEEQIVFTEKVLSAMDCNLLLTTPVDYTSIYFYFFPYSSIIHAALKDLINVAMVLPSACQYVSEEIFYGAVLAVIQWKRVELHDVERQMQKALSDCWEKAESVRDLILSVMRSIIISS